MSDATETEEVTVAAKGAAAPKKSKGDPLAGISLLIGILGLIACLVAIAISFM